jgi:Zn-dependent protease with chaperone function
MMRRHELDPVSLTIGFAFAGLGLLFLIGQADQALRLRWIWPLLLIVLGAGILLDVSRTRARTPDTAAPEPTPTDWEPEPARSDLERGATRPDSAPEATRPDSVSENAPADPDPSAATAELGPDPAPGRAVDNPEHPI